MSEAGRKGGLTTRERYGRDHFREIGRNGGLTGGAKGGLTTRARYGHEHFEAIGRKGGRKVRDLIQAGKKALDA